MWALGWSFRLHAWLSSLLFLSVSIIWVPKMLSFSETVSTTFWAQSWQQMSSLRWFSCRCILDFWPDSVLQQVLCYHHNHEKLVIQPGLRGFHQQKTSSVRKESRTESSQIKAQYALKIQTSHGWNAPSLYWTLKELKHSYNFYYQLHLLFCISNTGVSAGVPWKVPYIVQCMNTERKFL